MSEHRLPPNLRDWPENPFELLGVSEESDSRELRLAYNRLIRTYLPDSHPEEFQRVREAYETAMRHAEWRRQAAEWDRAADETEEVQAADDPPEQQHAAAGEVFDPAREARNCWELAEAGERERAYRGLVELHQRAPNRDDVLLRLYWLLKLERGLDAEREPAEWLAEGLLRHGLAGPLMALYLREVETNAGEAVSDRCRKILDVPGDPHRRRELFSRRWSSATRVGHWDVLKRDLDRERRRLEIDDTENWARLLFVAVDWLGWMPTTDEVKPLLRKCLAELNELEHLSLSLEGEFHRLDLLMELTQPSGLPAVYAAPQAWLLLIRESWNGNDAELRPRVRRMLQAWAVNPPQTLKQIDELHNQSAAAVERLEQLAIRLGRPSHDYAFDEDGELLRRYIQRWLLANFDLSYKKLRAGLLEFCLAEAIPLETVLDAAFERSGGRDAVSDETAQSLHADTALRCVVNGCNAFAG